MKIRMIEEVVSSQLCSGCGACAYMSPETVTMVDVVTQGLRPAIRPGMDACPEALQVCPGIGLAHDPTNSGDPTIEELRAAWGPVLEVWEGYATDPEIQFSGSSGGAISALALYCLEASGMQLVLHTAASENVAYMNETVLSHTRQDLLRATGSRYAPASPCAGLQSIEDAEGPCVFIGKPCDVAATQKARKLRPRLDTNLGVTIAFFCAGTPSTQGTLEMLKRMGVENTESLVSLRYRGNGWPGKATAVFRREDGMEGVGELTYEKSWGEVLSGYQQWRCKLCADHTGEFADIAVGDPWYRAVDDGDPGQSLILARTVRGRELILGAFSAGYLTIVPADPQILPASQPNLLRTRGALWGRLLACKLMYTPAPNFVNMPMFPHWCRHLTTMEKVRSIAGTIKRILKQRFSLAGRIGKEGAPSREAEGDG